MDEVYSLAGPKAYDIWTFILRLMASDKTDVHGVLAQDGQPMPPSEVVRNLKFWTRKVVERELPKLKSIRALSEFNGFLICTAMVRTETDRIQKLAARKPEKLKEKDKYFMSFFGLNAVQNESKLNPNEIQLANSSPIEGSQNGSGTRSAQKETSFQLATKNEERVNECNELTSSSIEASNGLDSSHAAALRAACDSSHDREEEKAREKSAELERQNEQKLEAERKRAEVAELERQQAERKAKDALMAELLDRAWGDEELAKRLRSDINDLRRVKRLPIMRQAEGAEYLRTHFNIAGVCLERIWELAQRGYFLFCEDNDYCYGEDFADEYQRIQAENAERERIAREEREYAEKVDAAPIKLRLMPQLGDLGAVKDFIEQQSPGLDWSDVWQRAKELDYARCDSNYGLFFGVTITPKAQRTTSGRFSKREVRTGSGQKGAWAMYTYTLDGTPYSTFKAEIDGVMQGVVEGNKVEFTLELNGDFENIVDAKVLSTDDTA
jgi:hypothetical protein